jgi:hypothetical protein
MTNEELCDRFEIQDLVARFGDAINHMEVRRIKALCIAEVRFIINGWTELEGIDEMVGFLSGMVGHWDVIFQAVHPGVVELAGDRATGAWYTTEYGRYSDGNEVFLGGLYNDEYVRVDGGWYFASRTFRGLFRRAEPVGPELKVRLPLTKRPLQPSPGETVR